MAQRVPTGLGSPGKALWRSIVKKYDLDVRELVTLESAAKQADTIAELEAQLSATGMMIEGSTGQVRLNPIVPEIRQARLALLRLLGDLDLPDEVTGKVTTPAQRHASKASRARWQVVS